MRNFRNRNHAYLVVGRDMDGKVTDFILYDSEQKATFSLIRRYRALKEEGRDVVYDPDANKVIYHATTKETIWSVEKHRIC